ncbi:MAG: type II CAAX endopeptidase family protein [Candidatus Omnitrophota bacterium]|nr:type II CAAX endopeptidase family protein [Candidatus Omnitrophota bacterium]
MSNFLRRERAYIWMAIFILSVNLLGIGHARGKNLKARKNISSMSFKDMGVTEEKIKLFLESERPGAKFFRYGFFAGVFMLLGGAVTNLILLLGRKKIVLEKNPDKISVSWGIADVLRVAVVVIFSGYMLGASSSALSNLFHFNIDANLGMILGTFSMDMIAGAAILYFVLIKYKERLSSLGVMGAGFYKNVLSGLTAYVFIFPVLVAVLILSMMLLNAIGYKFPAQPVFDMFLEEKRSNVILFLTVFVSILGPIIEEVFFRGFLYSAARKRFGVLSGALLSAVLFSILHTNIAGFIPIMILGILMAFLYETTGSLIAPITVHIVHNSIIVGFVFFIKQVIRG